MQNYKDANNKLHVLSEQDIANGGEKYLPAGCVPITAEEAEALRPSPGPVVPASVTMRQARLALLQAGLLNTVNDAVAAMPGVEGQAARIEWEYSQEVQRNKALVQALAPVLNLTDAQLDQLFIAASTL